MARLVELTSGYSASTSDKDHNAVLNAGPWFAHESKEMDSQNNSKRQALTFGIIPDNTQEAADAYGQSRKEVHGKFAITNAMLRSKV